MLIATSCFSQWTSGVRFFILVLRALGNKRTWQAEQQELHQPRAGALPLLSAAKFLSWDVPEAPTHSHKDKVEHICKKKMITTICFLLQVGQERADVTRARLSLKKQQGSCKSLWCPGQSHPEMCSSHTPSSNSSTKPIKGLKTHQDPQPLSIFGSEQLERDSLKDFGAWGTRKPHLEVQRIPLWDSNYLAVKDINLKFSRVQDIPLFIVHPICNEIISKWWIQI